MSEVKIPIQVRGNHAVLSLSVSSHSGLTDDDVLACLRPFVDDVERDLQRRIEVAQ